MGLTTSRESIERQASSTKVIPDTYAANGVKHEQCCSASNDQAKPDAMLEGTRNGSASEVSPPSNMKKRNLERVEEQLPPVPRHHHQQKKQKRNATPKKTPSKKMPVKIEKGKGTDTGVAKINPHRAKILVAKQALAAIKEGTRIYIKSGEGNGGDTWWDSGVIQKSDTGSARKRWGLGGILTCQGVSAVRTLGTLARSHRLMGLRYEGQAVPREDRNLAQHRMSSVSPASEDPNLLRATAIHERGKPYEIEWEGINNRGEEVDTEVEKRVTLPVTYSLAGVAVEALKNTAPGRENAARARESVLAGARIGSWCIRYPAEPWGTLDPFAKPFGKDSSLAPRGNQSTLISVPKSGTPLA